MQRWTMPQLTLVTCQHAPCQEPFSNILQSAHCILELLHLLAVKARPLHMRPRALQQVLAVVPEVA